MKQKLKRFMAGFMAMLLCNVFYADKIHSFSCVLFQAVHIPISALK